MNYDQATEELAEPGTPMLPRRGQLPFVAIILKDISHDARSAGQRTERLGSIRLRIERTLDESFPELCGVHSGLPRCD